MNTKKKITIDPLIFWPALLVVGALCLPLLFNPKAGSTYVNNALSYFTNEWGWMYLVFTIGAFIYFIWLAAGRYGHVKMGGPDDEPEFSTFSWIAMLFCAGIGSSCVYWSIIEPIYYLSTPPFGVEKGSSMAVEWAATYGAFHWGFSGWAIYLTPTIPIAYSYYVRKRPQLRMSAASEGILGKYSKGFLGKAIDIFVVIGMVGGVGTSLGLGTPMISACISKIFGIPESFGLNVVILVIWVMIFGTSVYMGLAKGIKRLSDINVWLGFFLLAFVLLFTGCANWMLNLFTNSVGLILDNFFRMHMWTDPIAKSGFPQSWTIFYWCWWAAFTPMVGLFVARISRGRTIREIVIAMCLFANIGCWLCFCIFGGYSLHTELFGGQSMTALMADVGPAMAIATILSTLPLSKIILPLFVVLMFVFLATTLDSTAYTLASITTKELHGDDEPSRWNRLLWAGVLGLIAITMFAIGGLKVIQASSVVTGFPVLFILILCLFSFAKDLKYDYGKICAPVSPNPVNYSIEPVPVIERYTTETRVDCGELVLEPIRNEELEQR